MKRLCVFFVISLEKNCLIRANLLNIKMHMDRFSMPSKAYMANEKVSSCNNNTSDHHWKSDSVERKKKKKAIVRIQLV